MDSARKAPGSKSLLGPAASQAPRLSYYHPAFSCLFCFYSFLFTGLSSFRVVYVCVYNCGQVLLRVEDFQNVGDS